MIKDIPYPFGKITDDVGFESADLSLKTNDAVPKSIGGTFVINELYILTRQNLTSNQIDVYINNNDLNNIEWKDNNTFGEDFVNCDNCILVSNYCLSEIPLEFRKKYLKNLLPVIDGAYMIWNSESKEGLPFIINEEDEDPQTGFINKKIYF
jgi:hypothetical protein